MGKEYVGSEEVGIPCKEVPTVRPHHVFTSPAEGSLRRGPNGPHDIRLTWHTEARRLDQEDRL